MSDDQAVPPPADAIKAAWEAWYSETYGADYPNGTEFDSGEMFEAFAAGAARALADAHLVPDSLIDETRRDEREACARLAEQRAAVADADRASISGDVLRWFAEVIRARTTP